MLKRLSKNRTAADESADCVHNPTHEQTRTVYTRTYTYEEKQYLAKEVSSVHHRIGKIVTYATLLPYATGWWQVKHT
jgi:hypothetical protein